MEGTACGQVMLQASFQSLVGSDYKWFVITLILNVLLLSSFCLLLSLDCGRSVDSFFIVLVIVAAGKRYMSMWQFQYDSTSGTCY